MKWIPANSKSPIHAQYIDVWKNGYRLCNVIFFEDKGFSDTDKHGNWHVLSDVTHWMPLPEKPEED